MLEYRGRMRFRSAWSGLLLLVVMAVACFGPACGVACAAKAPCHEAEAMADCDGMVMGPSVAAAPAHTAVCAQDEAVVDRSDFGMHRVAVDAVAYPGLRVDVVSREVAVTAVRGMVKSPPRLASVMRV